MIQPAASGWKLLQYCSMETPSGRLVFLKKKLLDEQETRHVASLAGRMWGKNPGQTDLRDTKAATATYNTMVSMITN